MNKIKNNSPSYNIKLQSKKTHEKLKNLVLPHIESFNSFITTNIDLILKDLNDYKYTFPLVHLNYNDSQKIKDEKLWNSPQLKIWIENIQIRPPMKRFNNTYVPKLPRECRERGESYSGKIIANMCYQILPPPITIDDNLEQKENTDILYPNNDMTSHIEGEVINNMNSAIQTNFFEMELGELPIMINSKLCHLYNKTPKELINLGEEATELGGYFIVSGIERVIRLLQIPRRNYPIAVDRPSYKNKGENFTSKAILMRCARPDESTQTISLHYIKTGDIKLRFTYNKQEMFIPLLVIIRALKQCTDYEIFEQIIEKDYNNTFVTARLELLFKENVKLDITSQKDALSSIGEVFRTGYIPNMTNAQVGYKIIKDYIFVNTNDFNEKQQILYHMIRKLYALIGNKCGVDNTDSFNHLDILLPGHLIGTYFKEKISEMFINIKLNIIKELQTKEKEIYDILNNKNQYITQIDYIKKIIRRTNNIGIKILKFLSTGTIVTSTGLDLMQITGYTIVAERLNFYRFLSHFRSIHRGQFFSEMKTTSVRKLLPESWGYLCPVHTPDGSPCGLLNHITEKSIIITENQLDNINNNNNNDNINIQYTEKKLIEILISLGMRTIENNIIESNLNGLTISLDGKIIGKISFSLIDKFINDLRQLKINLDINPNLEVAYLPHKNHNILKNNNNDINDNDNNEKIASSRPYPGIYIFSRTARMIRPVIQLDTNKIEMIGPLEQTFLNIATLKDDINENTTHYESDPTNLLSLIASLTPFSDYNQSPRNMYQCQMGKQTMGTPAIALPNRTDNKLYRILFPQSPIVQNKNNFEYQIDEYAQGTNAIVAVISYTGLDMEDAMILNKSSYERGFGHGCVYKTKFIELNDKKKLNQISDYRLSNLRPKSKYDNENDNDNENNNNNNNKICDTLDDDGLPKIGTWLNEGDPLYCSVNNINGDIKIERHKDSQKACVESIRLISNEGDENNNNHMISNLHRASITLRYQRNPIVGDKFSSRHGQKGVLSVLWPQENMPFSESGITPDIIINPHAFPSRMTIGMLIESMAGKSGALHGIYQDATPFRFHEDKKIIDYFGNQLLKAGYSYYGSEKMYSGLSGTLMKAEIFIGVVYYQRLRHMVSDKSQVRANGPINPLTRQPVKGRKRHGGIRLGEMERDSLLSHGVTFCLHDRLMNSSDKDYAWVCKQCGSLISTMEGNHDLIKIKSNKKSRGRYNQSYCRICQTQNTTRKITIPYVFRYLINELGGYNINLQLNIDS